KVEKFGKNADPEECLTWISKTEQIFDLQQLNDAQRVAYASIKFEGFADQWWTEEKEDRARNGDDPIETWEELKEALKFRFVPVDFTARVHERLEQLKQGSRSPDEYYKELKTL